MLCKRLIEVDLPIRRISAHARREKSIRHGHISTLHIWWARRPLAACRAVICAALWPDPADESCPEAFRKTARAEMRKWTSHDRQEMLGEESRPRFEKARQKPALFDNPTELRRALLDFIADFANWDNSTIKEYLETSRALTQTAHEALGGAPGTRPLVVDPFAGGGSIPLEALRVGADAFASDLNPIPVLLNKVVLEYIPKYGQRLADEVRKWGEWIKKEAEKELAEFYPKDPDGATPIAYLWARTIQCEGPGCGAEVPLIRSLWLAKKANRSVALQLVPRSRAKRVDFKIIVKQGKGWVNQDDPKEKIADPTFDGTVKRGSATCPCCGYTTSVMRVREQFKARGGGSSDARLMCVATTMRDEQGRRFRLPSRFDDMSVGAAMRRFSAPSIQSAIPHEKISMREIRRISVPIYGMTSWGQAFAPRQLVALLTLLDLTGVAGAKARRSVDAGLCDAIQTILALAVNRLTDISNALCRWKPTMTQVINLFGRQAIPMMWDFAETSPLSYAAGDFSTTLGNMLRVLDENQVISRSGTTSKNSATSQPLPDDAADCIFTDPPYYDAVPYAHLSDFFYVWLKRSLRSVHPGVLDADLTPKDEEIVVDRPHQLSDSNHDITFYEHELTRAFAESRRVLRPDGVGTIVFASKTTASWEAVLKAVVDAGWVITSSWPIDTEMENKVAALGQARLMSSVHIVCRPRENPDGSVADDAVGDWRDVLAELPRRIHDWMPRLAEEGVVGADAIFACLGPALEIFSRYSRVEKASGEAVTLKQYLEEVWAAVAKEALAMIFAGADATGFEEDARLTAMWLWTLKTDEVPAEVTEEEEEGEDDAASSKAGKAKGGFVLEFDAARKIAQGLGAHLENLENLVEVSGETARLLPVAERARALFGKDEGKAVPVRKKRQPQMELFAEPDQEGDSPGLAATKVEKVGDTVLDRVHQSMLLFSAGRTEALKRFLTEDGAGKDQRFWRLAQALSALYPTHTDEKRWVDGVLAKKKGLGF